MRSIMALGLLLSLAGCQSAYYGAAETFGIHKRDILLDRVEGSRDAQGEAQEAFQTALEQLTFEEWEAEIDEYSSASLKAGSQRKLYETRGRYAKTIEAMRESTLKRDPVLAPSGDQSACSGRSAVNTTVSVAACHSRRVWFRWVMSSSKSTSCLSESASRRDAATVKYSHVSRCPASKPVRCSACNSPAEFMT